MSSEAETPSQSTRIVLHRPDRRLCTLTEALVSKVVTTLHCAGNDELAGKVSHAARKMPKPTTRYAARMEWYEHALPPHNSNTIERYLQETVQLSVPIGQEPAIVREAKLHLLDTYTVPGSNLASTARALGVSKEHLARRFKAHTGMTVLDYLHRIRISDALIGMVQHEQLKAVAFEAGYGSYNDFYRNFRKRVGVNPQQLLAEMREPLRASAGAYTG